jgi:predicted dehydrogenase
VPTYADLSIALKRSDVDAVYVATPVFLHAENTIESLRAGKHVLCEKPVAMNYAEACSMRDAAEEAGRTLGIAYYRRTYPKVNRALDLIRQGAIGVPVLAEANCHSWFSPQDQEDWRFDPIRAGGGPLYDIGSHRIDLMNLLFGQPLKVTGLRSNVIHMTPVEDAATILIDYDSKVRGVVDVRWHSHVPRDDFRIHGTEGLMELSPLNSPDLSYPGGREDLPPHPNLHYPCVEDFVSAVLDGRTPRASAKSSIWTDWVTERVTSAGQSG